MGGKKLLLDKNSKLSAQVTVQRKEINKLQRELQEIMDRELQWQDTIACLNMVWEELNLTISFLKFKVTGQSSELASEPQKEDMEQLLRESNPFLALLLQNYLPEDQVAASSAKTLAEDLAETEAALRKKMKDTMSSAAAVLKMVEELKKNGTIAKDEGAEAKLSALVTMLKAENKKLRNGMTQDAVLIRNLESEVAGVY